MRLGFIRFGCIGIVGILATTAAAGSVSARAGRASTVQFGAKITSSVQPTSNPAEPCSDNLGGSKSTKCTWILEQAFGQAGKQQAPGNGTIKTIKVMAGAKGSFTLQIAQVTATATPTKEMAKVVRNGPTLSYTGAGNNNGSPWHPQSFKVSVPVKKGQYLAISTSATAMLNCSGGGNNTALIKPPLVPGQAARKISGQDGCFLLIQAILG